MENIIVHIYHGSVKRKEFRLEPIDLEGIFGHVAVQINDRVYDFYYKDKKSIHIFPRRKDKNCVFKNQSLAEWNEIVAHKKVTTLTIPVTPEEKKYLINFYKQNVENPQYDYSFFGERCASSCYHMLKSINKIEGGHYLWNAFYPEQLRKKLIKEAKKRNYLVSVKEGSENRIWIG